MPLLTSDFTGSWLRFSGHLETIAPALLRNVQVPYSRYRLELADGDFIDLDRLQRKQKRVILLLHGLEGSSASQYMQGFARYFQEQDWDICAMNFRSCSGLPNRLLTSYHSGATADVDRVIRHLTETWGYEAIVAIGFSLGGNMLLKYLGEKRYPVPLQLKGAMSFSAPVNLADSALEMAKPDNRLYMFRFLKSLRKKIRDKSQLFPGALDISGIDRIRDFHTFDNRFTAPIHGFRDAADYYAQCSAAPFLHNIQVPTLLVNARNDPFLGKGCYPVDAAGNPALYIEYPDFGGHVGFARHTPFGRFWSEARAGRFIKEQIFINSL